MIRALFTFILFLPFVVKGQVHYHGVVFRSDNQVPLDNVSIKLSDINDSTVNKSLLSDPAGQFNFDKLAAGDYNMEFKILGYQTVEKMVHILPDSTLKRDSIFLEKADIKIEEVTVTGKKKLITHKPDRVILNLDGSDLAQGNDVLSILSMSPYVVVTNNQLKVQGKSNVAIFLDKQRLLNIDLQTILSTLPGDKIDRIEIITSPSAKYDGNTTAVIEIYTKKNKNYGVAGAVEGSAFQGIKTGGSGSANASLNLGKLYIEGDANHNFKKMIERGYQNRLLIREAEEIGRLDQDIDFSNNNYNAGSHAIGINVQPNSKESFGAKLRRNYNYYDGRGDVRISKNENGVLTEISSSNDIDYDITNMSVGANYSRTLDSLQSKLDIFGDFVSYRNEKQQQLHEQEENETRQTDNNTLSEFKVTTLAADFDKNFNGWTYSLGTKFINTISDNTQSFRQDNNPPSDLQSNFRESILAFYISSDFALSPNLRVATGLRSEMTDYTLTAGGDLKRTYLHWLPKLRFDYAINDSYSVSLGYARNINRPSYAKLIPYEFIIDNFTVSRGNAQLIPEVGNEFALNANMGNMNVAVLYTLTNNSLNDFYLYNPDTYAYTLTTANFFNRKQWTTSISRPFRFLPFWNANLYLEGNHMSFKYPSLSDGTTAEKSKYFGSISFYNSLTIGKGWSAEAIFYGSTAFLDGLYEIGPFSNTTLGIRKSLWKKKAFIKLAVSDLFYDANMKVRTNDLPSISESYLKRDTRRISLSFKYNFSVGKKAKNKSIKNSDNSDLEGRLGI